ncbi:carbon-nitrogen hydrolase family protein [Fulvivirgaceae bacterium BMA12]|uniref:Carbon-nitrogen hydrolase family protein n=2 Tax=Agaribacillus aureus TaxID=3051825 RepID=A0ABT8LA92_9BACT|nr:carbon-nitrogen hydrolase family protein [Fulvivirgaceae bacterium BMA12]
MQTVKVAVVQAAPALFDLNKTLEKTAVLVKEAAQKGAQLILFPEAFIPAYPRGFTFGTVVGSRSEEGKKLWLRYWENAVNMQGKEIEKLGSIAKENKVYLAIGVIERAENGGTLYCTLLYFSPRGALLARHQKLKPTAAERVIWGEGDGSTLSTIKTELGVLGGLICWENYMPLARMSMYQKGVQLYLAPTADHRETWQTTMRHIATEGRCFVLSCNQFVTKSMYPPDLPTLEELKDQPEIMSKGGSVIINPQGEILAGPLWNEEGILYADLNMDDLHKSKMDFDVAGHYAREDVFQFAVLNQPETLNFQG